MNNYYYKPIYSFFLLYRMVDWSMIWKFCVLEAYALFIQTYVQTVIDSSRQRLDTILIQVFSVCDIDFVYYLSWSKRDATDIQRSWIKAILPFRAAGHLTVLSFHSQSPIISHTYVSFLQPVSIPQNCAQM